MNKSQKEELAKYKKSNKDRKTAMLKKMGYESQVEYFEALGIELKKVPLKVLKDFKKTKKSPVDTKPTDYVIAFDTTGSMASYISSVKEHVVELIDKLFSNSPDLRMKIVAFGDYCDMPSGSAFGKAYQESRMTDNKTELIKFVKGAENTSGGDGDEFYELVIRKINTETPWRKDVAKAVLLIGDAHCHPVGYSYGNIKNDIDWKQEAEEAKKLGVQYDTLMIHPNIDWYAKLSEITRGVSMNFKNANKISEVVEGSVYARSSTTAFAASYSSAMSSGDAELIGAYKSMSTLLDDEK